MIRVAAVLASLALGAGATACGRSQGVTDDQLGSLVIEPKPSAKRIDVERAAQEPAELERALELPYTKVLVALGPHATAVKTTTTIIEAGKVASDLTDETTIENAEAGAFRGLYNNSADYGRETIFIGGKLYLRPRYQRWHGRLPEAPDEPVRLRDAYYEAIAATWDLVGFAAELTDRGVVQVAGRAGRKIEVKRSPSAEKPPRETLDQRKWREGRSIEALAGTVVLDAEHGVPLSVELTASVGFSREGRSFIMKLVLDSKVSAIGTPATLAAPAEAEVVATPGRLREVDDRDTLLQGIAPPLRRNADGTAVPPSPATTLGSAAPAKPASDKPAPDKPAPDKPTPDRSGDKP